MTVALLLLGGCSASSPAGTPLDRVAASIPLDLSGPRPIAQLTLTGAAPVPVIFDTGAAVSIIEREYARARGLPDEGEARAAGPGGVPVDGFRTTIAGRLGGAPFDPALAVAVAIPLPLPGVVGAISPAVFAGRLVRFDFPRSTVRILPRTAASIPRQPGFAYSGGGLPALSITRVPTAPLVLPDGASLTANLDSGYDGGIELPLSRAVELPLTGPLAPAPAARMIGSSHRAFVGSVAGTLRLGGVALANPSITFVDSDASPPKIGMAILHRRIVLLDPANHRDWLY